MTGTAILCCGDVVLDLVPAALADGTPGFRPVCGGAAANSAVALARMGAPASFAGAIGDDPAGHTLAENLRGEGVDTQHLSTLDKPTSRVLAQPVPDGTRFDLYITGTASPAYAPRPRLLTKEVKALVIGGISLMWQAGADYEALAGAAREQLVWLDLNIRPGLIADESGYRARLDRMMALADVIKVSDEDLDWLGGNAGNIQAAHPQAMVVHSRGAGGARILDAGIDLPAPMVTVSDTVGAGDILNAGILAHLWRAGALGKKLTCDHATLQGALRYGIAAASISVTRPGADAPTHEEITCAL